MAALFLAGSLVAYEQVFAANCVSPPFGLVGWWTGDGGATDFLGVNNGALQGGATANAAGVDGQAFGFNGTTAYVQIPDSAALRPANLTIEAWVNFTQLNSSGTAPAGQQYIAFKQNSRSGSFEGFVLGKARNGTGDYFVFLVTSADGVSAEADSAPTIQTGTWYHVAGVRGSNFVQLYLNGQLVSQASVGFPQDYGNYPLYFGSTGQSYWDGKLAGLLDEVSLYNRALAPAEILAIYTAGSAGKCKLPGAVNIISQPQSQTAASGGNVGFNVSANGTAPLSYQWWFNNAALAGATASGLTLNNVQLTNAGNYTVVVTNSASSTTSAVATLTVLAPPTITSQPMSQTNFVGTIAAFSASAAGGGLSYQWQVNGVNMAPSGSTDTPNTWQTKSPLPTSLQEVACGVIGGKIYTVGVHDGYAAPDTNSPTLVYDISSDTWTNANSPRPFAADHHAAVAYNGRLYLLGGLGSGAAGQVQIYDPATNGWSLGAPMPFAAGSCCVAQVVNGHIYVAGGVTGFVLFGSTGTTTNGLARYDAATNTWVMLAPMPVGRNHTASGTDGKKLYVFGGRDGGNSVANGYDTVQIYDPANNTWVSSTDPGSTLAPLPQARGGMGTAVFYKGEFYVMGGETLNGAGATVNFVYDRVDIYNVASNTWRLGTPMPTPRHGIYPVLYGNRIYVGGGGVHSGVSSSAVLDSYVVDIARITGATTSLLTISNVQPTDAGTYDLVVSNVGGAVTSAIVNLVITTNTAPALPAQSNRYIDVLTTLTVTNNAVDSDGPVETLVYQLISPPTGASVNSQGVITWTPTQAQGTTTNVLTTVVTDSGPPPLSVTNTFTVVVSGTYLGVNLQDPITAVADPLSDGFSNLIDYALGIDPRTPTHVREAIASSVVQNGGSLYQSLSFKRRKTALWLEYIPEVSGDKQTWFSDSTNIQQISVTPIDDQFDRVSVQDQTPVTSAKPRFLRLRVVGN